MRHCILEMSTQEDLTPPHSYGIVENRLYRSCAFTSASFEFIDSLNLKSIIYVSPELPFPQLKEYCVSRDIRFVHKGLEVWRPRHTKVVRAELVKETLEFILDRDNYPTMIMCSTGIYETGVIVGCLRKLQTWSFTSTMDEYRRFAGAKRRVPLEQFIELFDVDLVRRPGRDSLPDWALLELEEDERETREGIEPITGELISKGVKFDKKKSLVNDDD